MRYLRFFQFYLIFAFPIMLAAYAACATIAYFIFGDFGLVFFALFRMPMYHSMYPVQYLAVSSLAYAVVAAWWSFQRDGRDVGKRRILWIWGVLVLSFALAATGWGMLCMYHDMVAGYFPVNWPLRILCGGMLGAIGGLLVFLQSVPSNVLMTVVMFLMTSRLDALVRRHEILEGRAYRRIRYVFCGMTVLGFAFAVTQFVGFFSTWIACRE